MALPEATNVLKLSAKSAKVVEVVSPNDPRSEISIVGVWWSCLKQQQVVVLVNHLLHVVSPERRVIVVTFDDGEVDVGQAASRIV